MKKKITIAVTSVICLFAVIAGIAYSIQHDESKTDDKSTTKQVETVKEIIESQAIGEKTNVVMSKESSDSLYDRLDTDIATNDDLILNTKETDNALIKELDNSEYTITHPFIVQNPYGYSPLTAQILFNTEEECRVRVTVKGKKKENDITRQISELTTKHRIPVIGLYANYKNKVEIELLDNNNIVIEKQTYTIKTDVLPEKLRNVMQVEKRNKKSAFELFLMTGYETPYVYSFDGNGDIRWYLDWKYKSIGVYPLSNGHFLIESSDIMVPTASKARSGLLYEIDYTGRVYNRYYIQNGAHHDLTEMEPDGDLLVLSNSNEGFEMDMVEQYDRQTGEIVRTLNLREVFADSGLITWDDWAHLNTCSYDKEDNAVILSARNLHSVIKLDWDTGEIIWILCDGRFWEGTEYEKYVLKAKGDVSFQFQQHASYQLEEDLDGNPDTVELALFDNHNQKSAKVDYYDNDDYSYTTIYSIDEKAGTVKMLHRYQGAYSSITSNFQLLYDKNTMISVNASANADNRKARVYEFNYKTEETINEYSFTHASYRGYVMDINIDSCLVEIDTDGNYIKGQIRGLIKLDSDIDSTDNIVSDDVAALSRLDGAIMVYAKNHSYSQIIFRGENNTYVFDTTDIVMTQEVKYTYKVAVPITQLVPDTYEIIGNFNGKNQKFAQRIKIK